MYYNFTHPFWQFDLQAVLKYVNIIVAQKNQMKTIMKQSFVIILLSTMLFTCETIEVVTFKDKQQKHPRVRTAKSEKDSILRKRFADLELIYPPEKLFFRVFKQEKVLEVWTSSASPPNYIKVHEYPICRTSGKLGPKRQEGDLQIPEGFYHIDRFNPKSNFYLSLGINYPNRSDQILGKKGNLGGDIFLHGGCVTIGCIPITDAYIKELYWLSVQAKSNGQAKIPVHIFPTRLDNDTMEQLKKTSEYHAALIKFWENLQIGFQWFETHRNLPDISVKLDGTYHFSAPSSQ